MTNIITKFIIFFFFDFLSHLVFRTSICEDELDIFFLSSVLTDSITFSIIDSLFYEKKSVMKDSMKESVKESVNSAVKDSVNSTVKNLISETSAAVIFFNIKLSLISTLQEIKIKLIFLLYKQ